MQIWRVLLPIVVAALPATIQADPSQGLGGTWTLEPNLGQAAYLLASRGTDGDFLICFNSGNVRTVVVSAGPENSTLARGSCTVFSPSEDQGIVVDFRPGATEMPEHSVALGTFRVISQHGD